MLAGLSHGVAVHHKQRCVVLSNCRVYAGKELGYLLVLGFMQITVFGRDGTYSDTMEGEGKRGLS
jgi:hypothetical protein